MAYEETQVRISLDSDDTIGIRTGVPGMPGSADPNGGKQYFFVDVTDEHIAGLSATDGGDAIGVLQNKPQIVGEAATVAISGVTLLVCGTGGLTAGADVSTDATGKGVVTTSTHKVLAKCILPAGAGELATVLLRMN